MLEGEIEKILKYNYFKIFSISPSSILDIEGAYLYFKYKLFYSKIFK